MVPADRVDLVRTDEQRIARRRGHLRPYRHRQAALHERQPSLLLPNRPLSDLAQVLIDVIFQTIERIREQDDAVLLMEQNALAAFEIADYL